ncbi:MAG: M50 family metallopeptidase [Myxococcaceae bacterium]
MQTATGATLDAKRIVALTACIAVGVLFWNQPFLVPLKLLVVAMHESGHAVASLISGGSVKEIVISADQSGHCLSMERASFFTQVLTYSGGYVGSAIAGALLILLTFRFKAQKAVLYAMAIWLLVVGVIYAGNGFTRIFCLGSAVVIGLLARVLPKGVTEVVNLFLGAFTALYALFDLRDDLWHWDSRQSDAALLANITYIPALIWAVLWSAASVAVLGLSLWWSLRKGRSGSALSMPPLALRKL